MKLFQFPNKSAISWLSGGLLYVLGNEKVKKGAFWPFVTSLGIWSLGEATRGENRFRKGLGWAGLVAAAAITISSFRKRVLSR